MRTAEDLGPVGGKVLDVIRADVIGEGVIQLRVLQAALMGRGRQREEGLLPTGEVVDGRAIHRSIARAWLWRGRRAAKPAPARDTLEPN